MMPAKYQTFPILLTTTLVLMLLVLTHGASSGQEAPVPDKSGRKLTGNLRLEDWPCCKWRITPDGERVVFAANNRPNVIVYSAPVDGSTAPVELSTSLTDHYAIEPFDLSPDGKWVEYETRNEATYMSSVYLVPVAGGASIKVYGPWYQGSIIITPDNTSIVISEPVSNTYDSWNFYVMPFPTGARQLLATVGAGNGRGTGSQLAPDSKTLLVYTDLDGDQDYELWVIPLAGGTLRKIADNVTGAYVPNAQFTPDSRYLLYQSIRGSACALCSVEVATGATLELVPKDGSVFFSQLHITNDNRVVFQGQMPGGTGNYDRLYSVQANGGAVTQLSTGLGSTQDVRDFQVSPDGKAAIFFVDSDHDENEVPMNAVVRTQVDAPVGEAVPIPLDAHQYISGIESTGNNSGVLVTVAEYSSSFPGTIWEYYVAINADQPPILLMRLISPKDTYYTYTMANDVGWLAQTETNRNAGHSTLYLYRPGTSLAQEIDADNGAGHYFYPQFDPLSRYVIYESDHHSDGSLALYIMFLPDDHYLPLMGKR